MSQLLNSFILFSITAFTADAQQQCYFGAGAENRGPASLVPCMSSGHSACCLLGDICLSGNACWNYDTGNTYLYGCTDESYQDESCPYKCGFNSSLSPWTAIEYCNPPPDVHDIWTCHAPESCGCEWDYNEGMLHLQPRACSDMGSDARKALTAPTKLAPCVSLPKTYAGSTGYFSGTTVNGTSTWIETAIPDYTPSKITQLTNYGPQPTEAILINERAKPSPSTVGAAVATTSNDEPTSTTSKDGDSTSVASTSTSVPASNGLTVGAKAGIGAGIGGGVLLIIIIALAILLIRKHRSKDQAAKQNTYPYPTGTPMQASPYFAQPDKDPWQAGTYSVGSSPPLMSPQFDPTYQNLYPHLIPSLYSEHRSAKPSSASPPTELSAGHDFHELMTDPTVIGDHARASPGRDESKPKSSSF